MLFFFCNFTFIFSFHNIVRFLVKVNRACIVAPFVSKVAHEYEGSAECPSVHVVLIKSGSIPAIIMKCQKSITCSGLRYIDGDAASEYMSNAISLFYI